MKSMRLFQPSLLLCLLLVSCVTTPPTPVSESRDELWEKFGNEPIDALLMAWGAPAGETYLTDHARLVTYRHTTIYDSQSLYEHAVGCDASFLARPPDYKIENIRLDGDPYECRLLVQGRTGEARSMYMSTPYQRQDHRYPF